MQRPQHRRKAESAHLAGTDPLRAPAGAGAGSNRLRVLIVSDRPLVRRGLATLLKPCQDVDQVGEAFSAAEAIHAIGAVRPEVVVVGLHANEMDNILATRAILTQHPEVRVIVLDVVPKQAVVKEALRSGAIGYLSEDVSAEELAAAIRTARDGRPGLAAKATEALMRAAMTDHPSEQELTNRERDILALLIQGFNNTKIARRLMVSRSTVKFHVSNILGKLGASTRTEVVLLALRRGLID